VEALRIVPHLRVCQFGFVRGFPFGKRCRVKDTPAGILPGRSVRGGAVSAVRT
jgi:hypothetical protein